MGFDRLINKMLANQKNRKTKASPPCNIILTDNDHHPINRLAMAWEAVSSSTAWHSANART